MNALTGAYLPESFSNSMYSIALCCPFSLSNERGLQGGSP